AAPGTGGSWLAAGCASISRWNAKIRPTHHARSGRLGADVGARRTPLRVRRLHVSSHLGSSHMGIWALIRIIRRIGPNRSEEFQDSISIAYVYLMMREVRALLLQEPLIPSRIALGAKEVG